MHKSRQRRTLRALMMGAVALSAGCVAADPAAQPASEPEGDPWQTIVTGDETLCSDGSPYHFSVKPGREDKLFVFLNGGGACWTAGTCDVEGGQPTYAPRADIPHNDPRTHGGAFNLANPDNPVGDWTLVFAPYCTGDVHLGDAVRTYTSEDGREFEIHHKGATNVRAVFDWIEQNQSPGQIVVAGGSAGALASPFYAGEMADRFPEADIVQFAGGSGGYRSEIVPHILDQWGASDVLRAREPYADAQALDFYMIYGREADAAPRIRFARYDNEYDYSQTMFRSLVEAPGTLGEALRATTAELNSGVENIASYQAGGDTHTIMRFDALYTRKVGDVAFVDWFGQVLDGVMPANVDCAEAPEGCDVDWREPLEQ